VILLFAVAAGLIAGLARVAVANRYATGKRANDPGPDTRSHSPYTLPPIEGGWLLIIAFVPQFLAFYLPPTSHLFTDDMAAIALTISQSLLLLFGWQNRHQPAFSLLLLGLFANYLVIVSNGGLMPMSPTTLAALVSAERATTWQSGDRIAHTKDRLLPEEETHFAILSDRFVLPKWTGYTVAYSVGDCIIALGAFWFLWGAGKPQPV